LTATHDGRAFSTYPIGLDDISRKPNIVYLHSHDTGRHVQPYGHLVETPRIQRLADEGLLFRHAFSAAPVCSPSRAALLTGEYSHVNGMLGLAHRGYRLADYDHHLVHTLRSAGYASALVGEQHVSLDPRDIGYDQIVDIGSTHASDVGSAAAELLHAAPTEPFFLSVGFFETHREYPEPEPRDLASALPPPNLPDTPETRRDMAAFKASARRLDGGVGTVLDAVGENTLVVLTTDHGLAFPGAKATLTDRGLGVLLIMRGPGGFSGGRVSDALVSQIDLYPTICELAGIEVPEWVRGRSLLPHARGETEEVNEEIFGELTYHAAYEPQRAIRTRRFKYIRRYDNGHDGPVLVNIDDGASKDLLIRNGLAERLPAFEQLYDLVFDPQETNNVAADRTYGPVLGELRYRLQRWMADTGDPLLWGPVEPRDGTEINLPQQCSPCDPTVAVSRR
jgi:N-sulfoglucosamine sulfohydrolase